MDHHPATGIAHDFDALVLGDEALQAQLGAIETREAFVDAALALAQEHGLSLDPEQVDARIRPDPIGVSRWMPSPVVLDRWPARGWRPAWTAPAGDAPAFDWAWFGDDPLSAPFYEASARRSLDRPFSAMFRTRTTLDALIAGMPTDVPAPAGFIYHMTRCGSTLVAQMLAADPAHCVLSEPEPLDTILCWAAASGAPFEVQVAAVRAIVAALARGRDTGPRRLFFKLGGWNTLVLPLLRAAFPDTPWVFIYREPVEVLVSQLRQRSPYLIAGALPPAIVDVPDAPSLADADYLGEALGRIVAAVPAHWSLGGGLLVNYAELPGAMLDRIAPHFGLVPDAAMRAAMTVTATRDAKAPGERFTPDAAVKREAATAQARTVADELLAPLHARLQHLQNQCQSGVCHP